MRTECNINTSNLYEKALAENVHWTNWSDWIPDQIIKASKNN